MYTFFQIGLYLREIWLDKVIYPLFEHHPTYKKNRIKILINLTLDSEVTNSCSGDIVSLWGCWHSSMFVDKDRICVTWLLRNLGNMWSLIFKHYITNVAPHYRTSSSWNRKLQLSIHARTYSFVQHPCDCFIVESKCNLNSLLFQKTSTFECEQILISKKYKRRKHIKLPFESINSIPRHN